MGATRRAVLWYSRAGWRLSPPEEPRMNRSRTQPRVPAKAAIAVAAACGLAAPAPPIAAQSTDPFPAVLDLESLSPPGGDGSLGFVIEGEREYGFAGESVASAGDVNGDGIDDLVIGAPGDYYYP